MRVDIGVFAHNEEAGIAIMVARILAQDVSGLDARVVVLANGCTDDTVTRARAAGAEVVDLPLGGKSRTWNRFVHDLARPTAEVLVFVDADIEFTAADSLKRLALGLAVRPALWVLNSQPVKDIVARPQNLPTLDKIIASAAGGLDDWKTAICGQFYAMPAIRARSLHLPIGLPVEDGFLRAMVLTDALTRPEDFSRIDGLDGLSHLYGSERHLSALIRHQIRIVIGSALNFAAFDTLRALPQGARRAALRQAAADEAWLSHAARAQLPRWPFGFVPLHFLTKRLARAFASPAQLRRPKRVVLLIMGFGFDLIVYVLAQYRMARGAGVGFW